MLPLHPFLYLGAGGGLALWVKHKPSQAWRKAVLGLLALWYIGRTMAVFPYEISYFNELVGGTKGGYRYLADSNVDWGQASNVYLGYLSAHPEVHTEVPEASLYPLPGRYIIGASQLHGIGLHKPHAYEWFRHQQPAEILAHSLLIYDVPEVKRDWIAQCEVPGAPLSAEIIAREISQAPLRQVHFDCTQSWVYPGGAITNGLYSINYQHFFSGELTFPTLLVGAPTPKGQFIARQLGNARLSFEHEKNDQYFPAFVLYEAPALTDAPVFSTPIYATPKLQTFPAQPLTAPVALQGGLALLGATSYAEGTGYTVESWWRVVAQPGARQFSIVASLVTADGVKFLTVNGAGVAPRQLMVGDVMVQRHYFSARPSQSELYLLTEVFWKDDFARWQVAGVADSESLLIRLDADSAR